MQPCVKGDLKGASKSPTLRSLKTEEMHQHKGLACSLLSRSLAHPGTVNAFLKRVCVPRCWRLVTAPPPPPHPQSLLHTKSGFSGLSQHFRVIFLDKWSHVSGNGDRIAWVHTHVPSDSLIYVGGLILIFTGLLHSLAP